MSAVGNSIINNEPHYSLERMVPALNFELRTNILPPRAMCLPTPLGYPICERSAVGAAVAEDASLCHIDGVVLSGESEALVELIGGERFLFGEELVGLFPS